MKHSPRDFKFEEKKQYSIGVSHTFEGKFVGYVEESGKTFAIFELSGMTDHGKKPVRKVDIDKIVSTRAVR